MRRGSSPWACKPAIAPRLHTLVAPGLSWKSRLRPSAGATARITPKKYVRRIPARWMALRRTLRRTLESAKSLKSRGCVRTGTRSVHDRYTTAIRRAYAFSMA